MKVSVITPVYNAAEFVTRAVESALAQPEVVEVLLVEDGSPDNSLEVCHGLAAKYEKVRLLRHPNGENRGAGASRNLGLRNATCEYIGFVDADNFYLPGRFDLTKQVFEANPDCEGVYEPISDFVHNEEGLNRWTSSNRPVRDIKGVTVNIEPEDLALELIFGKTGGITLDGLVIKKTLLERSGYMDEGLRLHQDSQFIIRLAIKGKMLPGNLSIPVAMRGIHDHNRISAPRPQRKIYAEHMKFWLHLYDWASNNASIEIQNAILTSILKYTRNEKIIKSFPRKIIPNTVIMTIRLFRIFKYKEILFVILRRKIPIISN